MENLFFRASIELSLFLSTPLLQVRWNLYNGWICYFSSFGDQVEVSNGLVEDIFCTPSPFFMLAISSWNWHYTTLIHCCQSVCTICFHLFKLVILAMSEKRKKVFLSSQDKLGCFLKKLKMVHWKNKWEVWHWRVYS